ncbi:deoxyribose-phosphate aldolase [Chytriomyces confervae]|uniref:deoxyribose-phosphate aldolase n=1 Tax=Chytriomyces confervae TaxID=246404 RepID=A0A507CKH0_9FUNG|nr:deoxyribose-phosphate aldolase [Chytriomyces confervae]
MSVTIPSWVHQVDLTSLDRAAETTASIAALSAKAVRLNTACVCLYSERINEVRAAHASLTVATVVNFPNGNETQESVSAESAKSIADGVDEIDVVWNYKAFNDGRLDEAVQPVLWVLDAIKKAGVAKKIAVKVILETGAIPEKDLRKACDLVLAAFVDPDTVYYLKTSTGKNGSTGATVTAATTMLEAIRDAGKLAFVGLKVSGGVKTRESAEEFAGLAKQFGCRHFRIGASSLLEGF